MPSFRRDIVQEDDLVEEIVRIWGYDRIPLILAAGGEITPVTRPPGLRVTRAASRALVDAGLAECITYCLRRPRAAQAPGLGRSGAARSAPEPAVGRALVMRPSLLPGLLEVLATNVHRQSPDVRAFEVGTIFSPHRDADGDRPAHEELWLGLAADRAARAARLACGARARGRLRRQGHGRAGAGRRGRARRGDGSRRAPGEEPAYLEPGRVARLVLDGTDVGWFGEVSARVREAFDLDAPVFAAGVALGALAARPAAVPRYVPLPRFPAVQRDLALVVADDVTVAEIEAAIRGLEVAWLARVQLFDVYSGSQVGAGRRSLAFGLTFQAPDRTLTDAEVNEQHARVVRELGRRFGAEVRGA